MSKLGEFVNHVALVMKWNTTALLTGRSLKRRLYTAKDYLTKRDGILAHLSFVALSFVLKREKTLQKEKQKLHQVCPSHGFSPEMWTFQAYPGHRLFFLTSNPVILTTGLHPWGTETLHFIQPCLLIQKRFQWCLNWTCVSERARGLCSRQSFQVILKDATGPFEYLDQHCILCIAEVLSVQVLNPILLSPLQLHASSMKLRAVHKVHAHIFVLTTTQWSLLGWE